MSCASFAGSAPAELPNSSKTAAALSTAAVKARRGVAFRPVRDAPVEELPRFIAPMLASGGPAPLTTGWALEIKWDGMRAQLRYDGRRVGVRSRPGRDCTDEFPELAELDNVLADRRVILDGELVCLAADGKPDFAALRRRLVGRSRRGADSHCRELVFIVFDLLHLDGRAVRNLPYWRRRELLAALELVSPVCRTPRHFVGEGEALLVATAEQGLEGVVAKRLDAPYAERRRSNAWVKQKHRRRERFVVTGWREREGALPEFLLARQLDGDMRPAGSGSLGLDADSREELLAALAERELTSGRRRRGIRWALPEIEVFADVHGRPDGPVRDAVLWEVRVPGLSEVRDAVPRIIAPAPETGRPLAAR
jgi:bifunctional non-homologous end joining protein LigD